MYYCFIITHYILFIIYLHLSVLSLIELLTIYYAYIKLLYLYTKKFGHNFGLYIGIYFIRFF